MKAKSTLGNNLCPDHRDKQHGKPCLACTIEGLERKLTEPVSIELTDEMIIAGALKLSNAYKVPFDYTAKKNAVDVFNIMQEAL